MIVGRLEPLVFTFFAWFERVGDHATARLSDQEVGGFVDLPILADVTEG
jgi:hypothetical protein